jgi:hypothetical protein
MLNSQFQQDLLNMEILLNEFHITYYRNGTIFTLPGCKMYYQGPELHWKVRNERFKMSSTRKYYIMHYLKVYCDAYEKFIIIRNIPGLLYDSVMFEIMPSYMKL